MDQTKQPLNNIRSVNLPEYQIPIEGSLGLLALGAVGILAWRKRKEDHKNKTKNQNSNTNQNG